MTIRGQSVQQLEGLETHHLPGGCTVQAGRLPQKLLLTAQEFEQLWSMHPEEFGQFKIYGKTHTVPNWQQVYGVEYLYPGQQSDSKPIPGIIEPLQRWAQQAIEPRFNSASVIWYDGAQGHYMGPHRDRTTSVIPNTLIVMLSFGEERVFRLSRKGVTPSIDIPVTSGSVITLPYATNEQWKHGVPHLGSHTGRRIAINFRALVTTTAKSSIVDLTRENL